MKSKHKYFEYKTKTSKIFPLSMFRLLVFKIFKEAPHVLNYIIIMQNIYFYFLNFKKFWLCTQFCISWQYTLLLSNCVLNFGSPLKYKLNVYLMYICEIALWNLSPMKFICIYLYIYINFFLTFESFSSIFFR